jgi:hypothetical protein
MKLIETDNTGAKLSAVQYCEKHYPDMTREFRLIMEEQYQLFCAKQFNYGPANIAVGTTLQTPDDIRLSLTGIWFRVSDKVNRLKQLIVLGHEDRVGESASDTLKDLSVYGIIAQIVQRGKWAK